MKQPLTIALDPRVHVSQTDLEAQLVASKRIVAGLAASSQAYESIASLRAAIADRLKTLGPVPEEKPAAEGGAGNAKEKTAEEKAKDAEAAKRAGASAPQGNATAQSGANAAAQAPVNPQAKASADALKDLDKKAATIQDGTFTSPGVGPVNRDLARTSFFVQSGDAAPSDTARAALEESCSALNKNLAAWHDLDANAVPATNVIIAKSSLAALPTATVMSITAAPQGATSNDACQP